jgi:hypothetical protein
VSEETGVSPSAGGSSGWYKRFIEGDFGLAKTYWLFGVLVSVLVKVVLYFTQSGNGVFVILVVWASPVFPDTTLSLSKLSRTHPG